MPREIAMLVHPGAGRGRGADSAAVAEPRLRDAGFAVRRLEGRDGDEARELARQAVEEGVETLVTVGGDGLVHLALQALAHSSTTLGIIPAGTGNDAARCFDIPRADPRAAADLVVAGRVRTVDVARTGPTYFLCVLSAGFDAIVNERANRMTWPRGQMRYNLATVAELRTFQALPYTLDLDGTTKSLEAMMVAVGNGTHTTHPAYEHHRVREVTVAAPGIVAYADGERLGPLPLTVTAVPQALRVLTGGKGSA